MGHSLYIQGRFNYLNQFTFVLQGISAILGNHPGRCPPSYRCMGPSLVLSVTPCPACLPTRYRVVSVPRPGANIARYHVRICDNLVDISQHPNTIHPTDNKHDKYHSSLPWLSFTITSGWSILSVDYICVYTKYYVLIHWFMTKLCYMVKCD